MVAGADWEAGIRHRIEGGVDNLYAGLKGIAVTGSRVASTGRRLNDLALELAPIEGFGQQIGSPVACSLPP